MVREILRQMSAKPIFTEEQYEEIRTAAKRVWKYKFEAEGQTQRQMALALGVSQQSVSNLLRGTYRPGLKIATEIATLDGKDLEELIGSFPSTPERQATRDLHGGPSAFPNLDICIQFHAASKHWSAWTVAAAKAGYFGLTDFAAPEWTTKLDGLERLMEKGRKT
jgi:transcriptional regulator with XRE-family HTH domain